MRYVPTNCLRENMIVGKTLYGKNGQVLLTINTKLTTNYIINLKKLGFSGIYIEDDLSEGIEIKEIVNTRLRNETIKVVKNLFSSTTDNDSKNKNKALDKIIINMESILDEIMTNKNLMINMLDLKSFDDYTFAHSLNVSILSIIIGIEYGLSKKELENLALGALLHDIGKVFIGNEIINKPSKLTKEEFEKIKNHPKLGYDYLSKFYSLNTSVLIGALDHHEKFDGTGYPSSYKGEEISLFGRIIAIADVYDALTSERPYRKGMFPSEAIEFIMSNSGVHFDPDLVKIFLKKAAPYPVGMCVKLSSGLIGIVVENYEESCLRPKIRVFKKDDLELKPFEISLRDDRNYLSTTIKEIIEI